MKFSHIAAALGVAAMVFGVAAAPDDARSEDQFTIGVTVWDVSTTPFAVPLVKGMRDAAEKANVNLIVSDPKWDASVQVENVREFIVQGVDAIAIAPIDIAGVLPAVQEALDAGIPVVGALGEIEGVPYIGVDDVEYGRLSARLMLEALATVEGEKRIVMFRGTAGGSPDRRRMQGMGEVLEASGVEHDWVDVTADWLPDKALTGFQDVLQRFPVAGSVTLVNSMGNCMVPPSLDWAQRLDRTEIMFRRYRPLFGRRAGHRDRQDVRRGLPGSADHGRARGRQPGCHECRRRLLDAAGLRPGPADLQLHAGQLRRVRGARLLAPRPGYRVAELWAVAGEAAAHTLSLPHRARRTRVRFCSGGRRTMSWSRR